MAIAWRIGEMDVNFIVANLSQRRCRLDEIQSRRVRSDLKLAAKMIEDPVEAQLRQPAITRPGCRSEDAIREPFLDPTRGVARVPLLQPCSALPCPAPVRKLVNPYRRREHQRDSQRRVESQFAGLGPQDVGLGEKPIEATVVRIEIFFDDD